MFVTNFCLIFAPSSGAVRKLVVRRVHNRNAFVIFY